MGLIGKDLSTKGVDMGDKNIVSIHFGPKEDPFEILSFEDWKKKQETTWVKVVSIPLARAHSIKTNITINKTNYEGES